MREYEKDNEKSNVVICAEFYEDPYSDSTNEFTIVSGIKLFRLPSDNIEEVAKDLLFNLVNQRPEVIKKHFPKFYNISMTRQYWFHIYTESSLKKNDFEEASLEDNLQTYFENPIEIYMDKDLNIIFNPPDKIDFFDSL